MWKRSRIAVGGIAAAAILASLATPAAAELSVVVTIKPIHSLVAAVMGETGAPKLLVGGSASPHTYAMKPSDAKALHGADVFIRVSEDLEPFTGKVVGSLPKSVRVISLVQTPGLRLLEKRTGPTFEAHGHGRGHRHEHAAGDAVDGHIWLDPDNAKKLVEHIAAVLSERSPETASTLKANAQNTIRQIDELAGEIARELEPVAGKPFIVFHDAYQYFEARFGLAAAGSITLSPEVQPSAQRLTKLRNKVKSLGAVCVFSEPQFPTKLTAAVAEGTGSRAGVIDPEGASLMPGPNLYTQLMRDLAVGLKGCLAGTS
jgi:zinc transport system substrate-binding protein